MSETRRQEAGRALWLSAVPGSHGLIFNEEYLHLESFFMCHIAWTNRQHVTLAPNEMLTNVDISNLIDI